MRGFLSSETNPSRTLVACATPFFPTRVRLTGRNTPSNMKAMLGALALLLVCLSPAAVARDEPIFSPTLSDAEVKARLLELVPALRDPSVTQRDQVRALRIWLHGFVPAASSATDVAAIVGRTHHQLSTAAMLSIAEHRAAGMMCGGHAELMRRLCRLVGFEAVAINFEVPGTAASHVLAVVRILHHGEPIWVVQDSYFNTGYVDDHGEPIPFEGLVQRVTQGRSAEIHNAKPWQVLAPALVKSDSNETGPLTQLEMSWSLETVIASHPELQLRLQQLTGTSHPAAFLLFPIGTSGEPDAERLASVARIEGYELARQVALRHGHTPVTVR